MAEIIKHNFLTRDWCTPQRCPCLTCEVWLDDTVKPQCACKPCDTPGLMNPEDVICWKTTGGEISVRDKDGKKIR